jgi:hypothetical protein
MTNAELDAIFADIDAGVERFKIAIAYMSHQNKIEAATRKIISLARTLQSMEDDDGESFSRNH